MSYGGTGWKHQEIKQSLKHNKIYLYIHLIYHFNNLPKQLIVKEEEKLESYEKLDKAQLIIKKYLN